MNKELDNLEWAMNFLKTLDEDKLKAVLRLCNLITDPLSQELIKKAMENGN